MSGLPQDHELQLHWWRAGVYRRVKCQEMPIKRGATREIKVASTAWKCEGRWQVDDQLDIWQCLDEVELDERRARGEEADRR
ncbi:hypothetical protein [Saccharopolyspora shandongensis]|uniref:hypothetical protein n=1 Tax=Saccharopolyspora shandongensis TaxID=418495 RepID=UPI0033BFE9C2